MSMGVAVSDCDGENKLESLLNHADAGLYQAKEKGRNRSNISHPSQPSASSPPVPKPQSSTLAPSAVIVGFRLLCG